MITQYEFPIVTFQKVNAGTREARVKQWLTHRMAYLKPGQMLRVPFGKIKLPPVGWFRKKEHQPWGSDITVLTRDDALYIISIPHGHETKEALVT